MTEAVLALNAGSSSIKFALYARGVGGAAARKPNSANAGQLHLSSRGQIESIGHAPHFQAKSPSGRVLEEQRWPGAATQTHETLLHTLLIWVDSHLGGDHLIAAGHRIVHGGPDLHGPEAVTPELLAKLDRLTPLAPLHQPHNLSPIRAIQKIRPELPQVACFDTAFHRTMPPVATRLALPRRFATEGVRRYGFHGLSYAFIAQKLRETAPELASGRVIVAHLGNGASLCAMRNGTSVDTTMGFTALDGLVMGTRCGTTDPGAILYIQQTHEISAADMEHMLYEQSGLAGVSGISNDMRTLLASREQAAREAVELFVFRIARETGGLVSSLEGLNGFIFTAGIGENSAAIREAVCTKLAWLGIELDAQANTRNHTRISTPQSRIEVRVIPTDEELMIAQEAANIVTK